MRDDELFCKKHKREKRTLAGESAHPDNWYCPECEKDARIRDLEQQLADTAQQRDQQMALHMDCVEQLAAAQEKLAALEARIAELLEVLRQSWNIGKVDAALAFVAISRTDDNSALNEYVAKAFEKSKIKIINATRGPGIKLDQYGLAVAQCLDAIGREAAEWRAKK